MDAVTLALIKSMAGNGGGGGGEKFIVTLTPTSPNFSGTMDKTVAEITAAYEAGQQIVYRVMLSATAYMDIDCTARYFDGETYPSFNAFILESGNDVLIFVSTGATNDGTRQTYSTAVYPLASSGGGVLVIHETVSGGTHTLDKTWQEIHDFDGISVVISDKPDGDGTMRKFDSVINVKDDPAYTVITGDYIEYTASSASGYPACSE